MPNHTISDRGEHDDVVVLPEMAPHPSELGVASSPTTPSPSGVLYYWDYLHLDEILSSQRLKSAEHGHEVHDEHLFIVVHQTYELWFKQIIVELGSALDLLSASPVGDRDFGVALVRLERVVTIQRHLVSQLDVLETMTPLDFLEFRSYLLPASGFQSVQFRLIENMVGLRQRDRLTVQGHDYAATLREDHAELVRRTEASPSLFDLVDRWLARNPYVKFEGFDFVDAYRSVITERHEATRRELQGSPVQLAAFEKGITKFDAVLDRDVWDDDVARGNRRLSYDAFVSALEISLYRDAPVFHSAHRLLTTLIDMDEALTLWRQRHAVMAHRMLGRLTGSAGSGYNYLDQTASQYSPFRDIFDLATYLVARDTLPPLPW